jgi:PAS domain S-box-containing protein
MTESKRAGLALRESEERYRRLFHESPDAICVHEVNSDVPMRFLEVNDVAVELLGYSREELLQMSPVYLETPDTRRQASNINERMQNGETVTFERIVVAKDGRQIPVEICCKPFLWQGELRVLSQARDITERKRAEEALCESEERFRLTFDQSPIGAAIVSLDMRYMRVNEMLCRITGYSSKELTKFRISAITHPDDLAKDLEFVPRLIAGEIDHYAMDKRYLRKDGTVAWVHLVARMMKTAAGQPLYMLPTMQDITERKLAEESLRRSEKLRAEAEKLAATGRMAAQVAHEINNPLAGIKNSFRLIRDAVPKDHPDRDMVGRIEREIDRIAHIVRQMYHVYSPRVKKPIDIPVGETVRDVLAMLEPLCREHEVTVECEAISPQLTVRANAGSLQQVLYNLLANAIQASPRAAIVHVAAELAAEDYVRIAIRDRGAGIPAEVQERMFEPFVSADTGDIPKQGLGLGLAIVKSIVESLGGRIGFEITKGEGTCFHVYLPSQQR